MEIPKWTPGKRTQLAHMHPVHVHGLDEGVPSLPAGEVPSVQAVQGVRDGAEDATGDLEGSSVAMGRRRRGDPRNYPDRGLSPRSLLQRFHACSLRPHACLPRTRHRRTQQEMQDMPENHETPWRGCRREAGETAPREGFGGLAGSVHHAGLPRQAPGKHELRLAAEKRIPHRNDHVEAAARLLSCDVANMPKCIGARRTPPTSAPSSHVSAPSPTLPHSPQDATKQNHTPSRYLTTFTLFFSARTRYIFPR